MDRQEFLSKLGVSMAAVCIGCSIVGCGSKVNDPGPDDGDGDNNPPAGTLMSVNLNNELQSVGASKITSGIILVRLAAANEPASFTAVQVACTHQGTNINFNTNQGIFICPNHGSEFSTTGSVIQGPATTALRQYKVSIEGSNLTVTA
ncbi:ubiquinol-cytochrome c reductase iron-sulfur subunit [Mucilaginibacter litoreus]|uniref:Ubiquinol-cytochrome c reductase iron-sulfur subunit n=1 Tax=Mucilaginibacter litoreus TaxID=1048221 RepID=A0ABW3AQI7_9SPHI